MNPFRRFLATAAIAATVAGPAFAYADSEYARPTVSRSQDSATAAAGKRMKVANRHLEKSVRGALAQQGNIDMSHLTILAKGGDITLVGSVPTNEQVQLAQQETQAADGVTGITNRLIVSTAGH